MPAIAAKADVRGSRGGAVLRRFSGPARRPAFWVALWAALLAAELVALLGHHDGRRAGGGLPRRLPPLRRCLRRLRADRLAPPARQPHRRADGPDRLRAPRRAACSRSSTRPPSGRSARCSRTPGASPSSPSCSPTWAAGRLPTTVDRVLVGALRRCSSALELFRHLFLERAGNFLLVLPDADVARRDRWRIAGLLSALGVSRHGGRDRRPLQARLAAAPAGDGAERRRHRRPPPLRGVQQYAGHPAAGALARGAVAAARARRRSSPACCARGWRAAASPTCSPRCRTMRGEALQARLAQGDSATRPRRRLPRRRRRLRRRRRAPVACPRRAGSLGRRWTAAGAHLRLRARRGPRPARGRRRGGGDRARARAARGRARLAELQATRLIRGGRRRAAAPRARPARRRPAAARRWWPSSCG